MSECGNDPGTSPCPSDSQCPLAQGYGGTAYTIRDNEPAEYSLVGVGVAKPY